MIAKSCQGRDFLISICVPTYNRCDYLKLTLESIVSQREFSLGSVQICVSDNASTDNTRSVVENFQEDFPTQIKYLRQEINIWDQNFKAVLEMADGLYLKLNNDTLCHSQGSLAYLINEILRSSANEALFFNGEKDFDAYDVDSFSRQLSFRATWIGGFGLWKKDKHLILSSPNVSTHLWQAEFTYSLVALKDVAKVRRSMYVRTLDAGPKGPYDFNDVFINQFLAILRGLKKSGAIKASTFNYLRGDVLIFFCASWAARSVLRQGSKFEIRNHFNHLIYWYKDRPHLIAAYLIMIIAAIIFYLTGKLRKFVCSKALF